MKSLLIQLDGQTLTALKRIAAPGRRQAIRKAIREAEYDAMHEPYRKQPDSVVVADDWSTAEVYTPKNSP
jgi:hypothetical protein